MTSGADPAHALSALEAGWWPAARIAPLGEGHIHLTWLVEPGTARAGRYVLQRISSVVFADPPGLMDKIVRIVGHVEMRAPGQVPQLVATRSGAWWHRDADGCCWRVWRHVEGARTLQVLTTPGQAEAAGRAFGQFQSWLSDLPGEVPDPIAGFMQLEHYLRRLDDVRDRVTADPATAAELASLLRVIDARRDLARTFGARNRFIHGDCKVNNLLFEQGGDAVVCILDLDTVMLGHWAWDAGDLVRSAAADATGFSLERFAAVVRGMREAGAIVAEAEAWALAPRYVTLMLGVRFLTDHLEGDRYFRVHRAGENLERARTQFRLLAEFERHEAAMIVAAR